MSESRTRLHQLLKVMLRLRSAQELEEFLEDLCTPSEIAALADRWHVVQLLQEGISYRTINEKSGVSTATVTRVARCLTYGSGGYRRALEKLREDL